MAKKTLNLTLQENFVTPEPNDYFARVQYQQTLTNTDFANDIAAERTELRPETIEYILNLGDAKKAQRLAEGYIVNTPFCIAKAGTTGVYNSPTEQFNKDKHTISANFTKGMAVREHLSDVVVTVQGMAQTDPVIGAVIDTLTGSKDSVITPNNVIQLVGSRMKIAGNTNEVGLSLRNIDDGTVTKITQIIINEPRQLLAMLPPLAPGSYELDLVTAFGTGSEPLKTPKSTTFNFVLSVE